MNPSLKRQLIKTFCQMINDLKNPQEVEQFFTDFLNSGEFETYAKRLATAYWIKKSRSEDVIKTNLKVAAREIAEAKKLLNKKGVRMGIKYIEAEEFANQWLEKFNKFKKN